MPLIRPTGGLGPGSTGGNNSSNTNNLTAVALLAMPASAFDTGSGSGPVPPSSSSSSSTANLTGLASRTFPSRAFPFVHKREGSSSGTNAAQSNAVPVNIPGTVPGRDEWAVDTDGTTPPSSFSITAVRAAAPRACALPAPGTRNH